MHSFKCQLYRSQASSSIDRMGQQLGLAVEHPTFPFHPKITPETISEGQKSPQKNLVRPLAEKDI